MVIICTFICSLRFRLRFHFLSFRFGELNLIFCNLYNRANKGNLFIAGRYKRIYHIYCMHYSDALCTEKINCSSSICCYKLLK